MPKYHAGESFISYHSSHVENWPCPCNDSADNHVIHFRMKSSTSITNVSAMNYFQKTSLYNHVRNIEDH